MRGWDRAFDRQFRPHWARYVLQSSLAGVSIFAVLVALRQQNLVVAASLAATAFTVFAVPSGVTASARNVVGGHLVGAALGSVFALLPHGTGVHQDATYAVAVGALVLAAIHALLRPVLMDLVAAPERR
jgi:CBS-domain-containing membrane protein